MAHVLGQGSHGTFYRAHEGDVPVFLKGYNSPSPRVAWYRAFLEHQQTIWERIAASPAARFTYRAIAFFEHERQYFQAVEHLEGLDVEAALEQGLGSPSARLIWTRVLTAGLAAFHDVGVVHCDLKPANLHLTPDPTIHAGHVLRIIDFDWAVRTDAPAPWHGSKDYVGTTNYASPEHLRGEVPGAASDVFTAALIVTELLLGIHPYRRETMGEYRDAVLAGAVDLNAIAGSGPMVERWRHYLPTLTATLDLDPTRRPSARELNDVLNGR
ncbi:MAG: hypothetical protein IV100_00225 [Myxococcales bacterium]|nr:hypothetical protein [Myxococcales bacterium]